MNLMNLPFHWINQKVVVINRWEINVVSGTAFAQFAVSWPTYSINTRSNTMGWRLTLCVALSLCKFNCFYSRHIVLCAMEYLENNLTVSRRLTHSIWNYWNTLLTLAGEAPNTFYRLRGFVYRESSRMPIIYKYHISTKCSSADPLCAHRNV